MPIVVHTEDFHFHHKIIDPSWVSNSFRTFQPKSSCYKDRFSSLIQKYWNCFTLCVVAIYTSEFSSRQCYTPEPLTGIRIPPGWTCLLVFMSEQIFRWWREVRGRKGTRGSKYVELKVENCRACLGNTNHSVSKYCYSSGKHQGILTVMK